ncbi:MAG: hypothetical protein KAG53_07715 [Endozoicomonadaceae bacterium]|nr:hypothetical protein [Endozoicomonadaceae bacterium]
MQKSFTTQPQLFVSATDLSHPILHSLDDTEALLEWVRRKPVQSTRNRYQTDYLALNAPVSFVMDDKMRKV